MRGEMNVRDPCVTASEAGEADLFSSGQLIGGCPRSCLISIYLSLFQADGGLTSVNDPHGVDSALDEKYKLGTGEERGLRWTAGRRMTCLAALSTISLLEMPICPESHTKRALT